MHLCFPVAMGLQKLEQSYQMDWASDLVVMAVQKHPKVPKVHQMQEQVDLVLQTRW